MAGSSPAMTESISTCLCANDVAMSPRTATLIGLTAIVMWSLLSVLTVATGKIPAFQLAAMTFAIGAAVAFASFIWRPAAFGALKQPLTAWVVGVGGLFGYHALYFLALRFAPPAEAGLLNYLWPLLIVLFSSLLPGERLAPHHIIGALLGLAATVWPETSAQWLAIIALGVGPVGAAFFTWDIGMKRGDIRVLGAASYATPLLSTAFLILAGFAQPSATIAIAAILIAGGGLIAAKHMVWKR